MKISQENNFFLINLQTVRVTRKRNDHVEHANGNNHQIKQFLGQKNSLKVHFPLFLLTENDFNQKLYCRTMNVRYVNQCAVTHWNDQIKYVK